ncbi:uncharacterized protein KD926_005255 [Aspergillus affinis]|uniref:uncharacterized protein n=1 Tax=Aspergillus affinis TaxID=1070780 RepID=UPI0022FEDFB6|nr:uncharacterized protein KD926_005255 [Aspergillus affinis]KAI9042649.1 hypothetical protein KD926_005255 [Aspergillus affinis]
MRKGLGLPAFSELPFDQFILVHPDYYPYKTYLSLYRIQGNWDLASPLSKHEQKRALVERWTVMGRYGRNVSYDVHFNLPEYALSAFEGPLLPNQSYLPDIPQDLLTETDRSVSTVLASAPRIRTWYGGLDQPRLEACVTKEFIYEDRNELARASNGPDIEAGVALGTPGSMPGYLVAVMMHCPELFEGCSDDEWRHFSGEEREEEESRTSQVAMVLVADRKACEEGWVLLLALNHRGQVLPFRVRERASEAAQHVVNWAEGQPLVEMTWKEDDEGEFNFTGGDGWD